MYGVTPEGFAGKFQGFQLRDLPEDKAADVVIESLLRQSTLADKVAKGMLTNLEESESFDQANERIQQMDRLSSFPRHLAPALEMASVFNNQLEGAWKVSGGVRRILQRVK